MSPATILPGDRVRDRDDPDPNDAIVVNQPPLTASEWTVESRDCTLAADNPDYPADAAVAVVCFCDDLIEYGPPFNPTEQIPLSLETLNESGVHYYTFPVPRLTVIESPATGLVATESPTEDEEQAPATPSTATDDAPATDTAQPAADGETANTDPDEIEPSPELQRLKTTLEDNGLAGELTDPETLTVERLGQTYAISPDGAIDGDGALRSQLETLVDETT